MQHNLLTYENVNVYLMLVFSILYIMLCYGISGNTFLSWFVIVVISYIEIVVIAPWLSESEINIQ